MERKGNDQELRYCAMITFNEIEEEDCKKRNS